MDAAPPSLRLLVLGPSGALGAGAGSVEASWPYLLWDGAGRELRRPVELDLRPYYPGNPGPVTYLRRVLESASPDIVVIRVIPIAFALPSVANRVERRFGKRPAHLIRSLDSRFTAARADRPPRRAELLARRAARRLIGADAPLRETDARRSVIEALSCLAAYESIEVVVGGLHAFSPWSEAANPGINATIREVNAFTRDEVLRRHFTWVEPGERQPSDYTRDGAHDSPSGHAKLARDLLPGVAAASARLSPTEPAVRRARLETT